MAQVAHDEHGLRRVIDEDREVDGLGEQELLDLYRAMVLLRTYDERSLVYHRQGRIGTYAIFWNHEAMRLGIAEAEAEPDPDVGLLFEHAYVNPPPSLAQDLAELRRILGGKLG